MTRLGMLLVALAALIAATRSTVLVAGIRSTALVGAGESRRWTSPAPSDSVREAVVALLRDQEAAWNRGDLEGFMRGYAASPDLVFTSGGRVLRGWKTILERYRTTYGQGNEMGTLTFSDLEVHELGQDAAWALGRWELMLERGRLGGVFTLVLQRLDGNWRIVHDHTSSDPDPAPSAPGAGGAPRGAEEER